MRGPRDYAGRVRRGGAAPAAVAPASQPQTRAQVFEGVKQMTALGKQLFFDPSLSAWQARLRVVP